MKRYWLILTLLTAACGPTYSDTLEAKLEGKNNAQKRAILAQECAEKTKAGVKAEDAKSVKNYEGFRKLCEEMTKQKINKGSTQ